MDHFFSHLAYLDYPWMGGLDLRRELLEVAASFILTWFYQSLIRGFLYTHRERPLQHSAGHHQSAKRSGEGSWRRAFPGNYEEDHEVHFQGQTEGTSRREALSKI